MILSSEIKNATETQRQTNKLYIAESFHKIKLCSLLPDISSILVLLICLNSEHYTSSSHICVNEGFLMR